VTRILHHCKHLLPLLIAALLGQSVAVAANPCALGHGIGEAAIEGEHHMPAHADATAGHSGHDHGTPRGMTDAPPASALDSTCCDSAGPCSMLDCLSVNALPMAFAALPFPRPEPAPSLASVPQPRGHHLDIYRPPSFA
jgi:hypothetical protein